MAQKGNILGLLFSENLLHFYLNEIMVCCIYVMVCNVLWWLEVWKLRFGVVIVGHNYFGCFFLQLGDFFSTIRSLLMVICFFIVKSGKNFSKKCFASKNRILQNFFCSKPEPILAPKSHEFGLIYNNFGQKLSQRKLSVKL